MEIQSIVALYEYIRLRSLHDTHLRPLRLASTAIERAEISSDKHVSADTLNRLENLMTNVKAGKIFRENIFDHVFFKDDEKSLEFLCNIANSIHHKEYEVQSDFDNAVRMNVCPDLDSEYVDLKDSGILKQKIADGDVHFFNWSERLTPQLKHYINKEFDLAVKQMGSRSYSSRDSSLANVPVHPKYNKTSIYSLLKMIRNLVNHELDIILYQDLISDLGLNALPKVRARKMINYFTTVYPGLMTATFVWASNRVEKNVVCERPSGYIMQAHCYQESEHDASFEDDWFYIQWMEKLVTLPPWCPNETKVLGDCFEEVSYQSSSEPGAAN